MNQAGIEINVKANLILTLDEELGKPDFHRSDVSWILHLGILVTGGDSARKSAEVMMNQGLTITFRLTRSELNSTRSGKHQWCQNGYEPQVPVLPVLHMELG